MTKVDVVNQKEKKQFFPKLRIKSRELKQNCKNRELKRNLVESKKKITHKADAKWIDENCWWLQRTEKAIQQIIRIVVDNDGHCAVSHKKFSVRPVQGIECPMRFVLE